MRLLLIIVGAFAAIVCFEKPAEAQSYPWCADGNYKGGATNCGFATFQHCLDTVRGEWRVLWTQSDVPAPAGTTFVD
jgi:Protein of unknown function (DUF3551)